MSRQTMIEAAEKLPRGDLFGIGVYQLDGEFIEFEMQGADVELDAAWAQEFLEAAGVTADDHVLFSQSNHEGPWLTAVLWALRRIGATYSPVEVYGWDVARYGSLIDRLPITVIFGVSEETVGALAGQHEDLSDYLSDVRLIWARPGAYERLVEEGVEARPLAMLGPVLGLGETPGVNEVVVNGASWEINEGDGQLLASTTPVRTVSVVNAPTGSSGRIVETGPTTRIAL